MPGAGGKPQAREMGRGQASCGRGHRHAVAAGAQRRARGHEGGALRAAPRGAGGASGAAFRAQTAETEGKEKGPVTNVI